MADRKPRTKGTARAPDRKPRARKRADAATRRLLPSGPALMLDTKGAVLAVNAQLRKLFGLPSEAGSGQRLSAFFPRRLAAAWRVMLGELVRDGAPVRRQVEYRDRCYESVMMPVLDDAGSPMRALLLISDVTEAQVGTTAAAQLAQEWQQTFDSISDIVALISPKFELLRVNRTGCLALGKTQAELIGKKCYHVVHHQDKPIDGCPCVEALKTKQDLVGEVNDAGRCFIATASPILDDKGRVTAFSHTVKDITERKQMTDELARHRDRLAELVEERTRELMAAHEEALHQSRLATVGRVAGSLAREMRVPLEIIREAAQKLARRLLAKPPSTHLVDIEREVARMDFTLNAILEFSQRSESHPTRSSVRSLLDLAVVQAGLPADVPVQVDLASGLPHVFADSRRLVAAFANLIVHAAQTMPDGGLVGILGEVSGDRVVLVFTNAGNEMGVEAARQLLEPIVPDTGTVADFGVTLAKGFIEADGGTIEVRAGPGKSPSFIVSLPTN